MKKDDLEFLNSGERFILNWTGTIIIGISGLGLLFTVAFDKIAGRIVYTFGWVQICGVIFSIALLIFGICVEKYLQEIKIILKDYIK